MNRFILFLTCTSAIVINGLVNANITLTRQQEKVLIDHYKETAAQQAQKELAEKQAAILKEKLAELSAPQQYVIDLINKVAEKKQTLVDAIKNQDKIEFDSTLAELQTILEFLESKGIKTSPVLDEVYEKAIEDYGLCATTIKSYRLKKLKTLTWQAPLSIIACTAAIALLNMIKNSQSTTKTVGICVSYSLWLSLGSIFVGIKSINSLKKIIYATSIVAKKNEKKRHFVTKIAEIKKA